MLDLQISGAQQLNVDVRIDSRTLVTVLACDLGWMYLSLVVGAYTNRKRLRKLFM